VIELMTDDTFYSPTHARAPRVPQPGELLFEFHVGRTHKVFRCELRDHGPYGVEAQFLEADGFRFYAQLFPTRELAVQWAHEERKLIERMGDDDLEKGDV
jgi:hypothetical protein